MILDIVSTTGPDLGLAKSDVSRAGNVLSIQVGSLLFAPDFGIDLKFFLDSEFKLQNASFKAYLVERLLAHRVNVVNVIEVIENVFTTLTFDIGVDDSGTELIA